MIEICITPRLALCINSNTDRCPEQKQQSTYQLYRNNCYMAYLNLHIKCNKRYKMLINTRLNVPQMNHQPGDVGTTGSVSESFISLLLTDGPMSN